MQDEAGKKFEIQNSDAIAPDSRLVGQVLLSEDVYICPKFIVVGPTIIGNDVKIEEGVVINSSIICQYVLLPSNTVVQNRVVTESNQEQLFFIKTPVQAFGKLSALGLGFRARGV